jgi:hypothetical protein
MNTADITCEKMTEQTNNRSLDYNDNNKWYNRVYLCWEDTNFKQPTTYKPIMGFKCYRYSSFENADYILNNLRETRPSLIASNRHTMIPMCKWVPEIFDKYILDYKLKRMYWLSKHTFGDGHNKFK